jgi:hypothetical protein
MALPLTPHMVAGAYFFLCTTPPFRGWRLPDADLITFTVNKHQLHCGTYQEGPGDRHEITISSECVGHTDSLIRYTAHEMIHLAHTILQTTPKGAVQHNADFRRKAIAACRYHGWDPRLFI